MGGKYCYGIDRIKKDLKMKHVSDIWEKLKDETRRKVIFLFLDYDGTLTPIVNTPDRANLSVSAKKLLKNLAGVSCVKLVIVSGRSLHDIKRMVGLKGIIYVGNHGLEIDAPGFKFISPVSPRIKAVIQNISSDLKNRLSGINGIITEDKGLTLSIHYRLAAKANLIKMRTVLKETIEPCFGGKKIKINKGKKVFEIKPSIKWNKGHAVLWLLKKMHVRYGKKNVLPIYIGDDITDEDAFREIKNKGLSIFVGRPKESHAQYYLRNHNEVQGFLRRILERCGGDLNRNTSFNLGRKIC